jgi:hypothetical protein
MADTASIVTGFGPLLPMLVMIVKASRRDCHPSPRITDR